MLEVKRSIIWPNFIKKDTNLRGVFGLLCSQNLMVTPKTLRIKSCGFSLTHNYSQMNLKVVLHKINIVITVPWLEISIDGCMIWPLAGKIRQNSLNVESVLKIDRCMCPLPQIDGCSCTRRTRTNKGPVNPIITKVLHK